jgi:hypothetical protein
VVIDLFGEVRFEPPLRPSKGGPRGNKYGPYNPAYSAMKATFKSEYNAWVNMKARCYNRYSTRFARWGGRGIGVCERWQHSFVNFFHDLGPKPEPKLTLERIDNDSNYEPSNCK